MNIEKAVLVGGGLRGSGIAQVCAQSGIRATLVDTRAEARQKALKSIAWPVNKMTQKGKVSGPVEEVMGRIGISGDYGAARGADLCVEAVCEYRKTKATAFRKLDRAAGSQAFPAPNTSAISISALASGRKLGPFEIGDPVGPDATHGALRSICEETKAPYWYPRPNLTRKAKAGHLGRKTGRGWYDYNPDGTPKERK